MLRIGQHFILSLCLILFSASALHAAAADFDTLLKESGLTFEVPENTTPIEPVKFPFFDFDKAFKHKTADLEMHVAVRPIGRMETSSYDAHGATPEPNFLYTMIFKSLASNLAEGTRNHRRKYSNALANELFNAGWANASQFRTAKKIGLKHKHGVLLAIHRHDHADAFILFLYNDGQAAKELINEYATALRFTPEGKAK